MTLNNVAVRSAIFLLLLILSLAALTDILFSSEPDLTNEWLMVGLTMFVLVLYFLLYFRRAFTKKS